MLSQEEGLRKRITHADAERDKLERALGGIKDMGGLPDILIVIDTTRSLLLLRKLKNLVFQLLLFLTPTAIQGELPFQFPEMMTL